MSDLTSAVDAAAKRVVDGPDVPGSETAGTWDRIPLQQKNAIKEQVLPIVWAAEPAIRAAVIRELAEQKKEHP